MRNITFITGEAGTGKSHKLRELLAAETRPHLICAPTGIAALNIGGATIHRTFKINPQTEIVGKRWPMVQVVYIDEVSMMGMKLFNQVILGAPNADFVFIGDMAQLPPVKDKYWFQSDYIGQFDIKIERLTKQWRQEGDQALAKTLSDIRKGDITASQLRKLYDASIHPDDNEEAVTLAYRNDTVKAINSAKLLKLKTELFEFEAEYEGLMKPQDCRAESLLQIKEGAEVIMINNDPESRWMNGTRAKVTAITEELDECFIEIEIGNKSYHVDAHTWQLKVPVELTGQRQWEIERQLSIEFNEELKHALDTGIEYKVIGTCKQFPMKLAYAMTVHKAQGLTLDAVHVITSGFAGCYAIGYVGLSRVRSSNTLSFDRRPVTGDFKFDKRIAGWI